MQNLRLCPSKEDTGKARLLNLGSQGIKTRAGDSFHCYIQESRGSSPKIGTVRTHGKGQRALPGPAWVCLPPWPWSRQAPLTSPASALHAQERRGRDLEGWHPHSRGQETLTPRLYPIPPTWRLSCCSVIQSCPTHCDPPGLEHPRLPCSSLSPRVCPNSCPLNRWCHPTISPSVTPFLSCPQSFPALRSFPMSWLFTSGDQSIGASVSASASFLPMNIQDWFPFGLIGLIFLQSKGLSRVFSSTTIQKHQFFGTQPSLWSNSHIHTWLLEKPQLWLYGPLSAEWCLCFLICFLGLS